MQKPTTMTTKQIEKAKEIIRKATRGPYKRVPSAQTDRIQVGIPGIVEDVVLFDVHVGDLSETDAAYLIGSADPFHGWNAALDALLTKATQPIAGSDGDRDANVAIDHAHQVLWNTQTELRVAKETIDDLDRQVASLRTERDQAIECERRMVTELNVARTLLTSKRREDPKFVELTEFYEKILSVTNSNDSDEAAEEVREFARLARKYKDETAKASADAPPTRTEASKSADAFAIARAVMAEAFVEGVAEPCRYGLGGRVTGGSVLATYTDNIAMRLLDSHKIPGHDRRNAIARDLMAMMFDLPIATTTRPPNWAPDTIPRFVDVVFDGPPGPTPTCGRFVEVENEIGHSISVGEWIDRKDGMWALRMPIERPSKIETVPTSATSATKPDPDVVRRITVKSSELRKGDVVLSCGGVTWMPSQELTDWPSTRPDGYTDIVYIPNGSNTPIRSPYSTCLSWVVERTMAPGYVDDEPANAAPRAEPRSEVRAFHPDESLVIVSGMTKRVVPFPFKITGTCAGLARFMECILENVDKDDQCNGESAHHEWIDVTAAPRVAAPLDDCAALEW